MSGQSGGRLKLAKLNEQLTCKLCKGYFIDATTIIECLHSFCRSCIVKYLETNKYCPICEVQVHKSKPLLNIRPDHTLQDIVYKLVPGCYQNEMRCRREFYEKHPDAPISSMSPEARGEPIESHIYSPDESLSLSLEYYNPTLNDSPICSETDEEKSSSSSSKSQPRRYLRCPAAVTVFHLQKLIRAKYGLSDAHRVDIMYKEEALYGNYTLMDVMYIYHWRRKVPLHLSYRIFESSPKRLKLSEDNEHFKTSLSNAGIIPQNTSHDDQNNVKREWKEVQLKISETGVMSVTGITSPDSKKLPKKETIEEEQRRLDESVANVVKQKQEKPEIQKRKSTEDKNDQKTSEDKPKKSTDKTSEKTSDKIQEKTTSTTESSTKTQEVTAKPKNEQKSTNSGSNPQVSGSKIESLSAKLQFQPKIGPVNNTYSKKSQKDKKSLLEKVLKKPETKNDTKKSQLTSITLSTTSVTSSTISKLSPSSSSSSSTASLSSVVSSPKLPVGTSSTHVNLNTFGGCTYSTAPSLSISLTPRRNSPDRGRDKNPQDNDNQKTQNSSETPGNLGLNVPVIGIQSSSFPFYMPNFDPTNLKTPQKSSSTSPKTSQSQFTLQTPSISMYTIPTSSAKHQNTTTITATTTTATTTTTTSSSSSRNPPKSLEITSVYSVPPCPDAIPISLMHSSKPTVRKTEILAKGTNVNEICAKISENSREKDLKNKNETRTRSEIPDLLKIPVKSSSSSTSVHGTIPNVPSYTPSNALTISSSDKGNTSRIGNPSSPQLLIHQQKVTTPKKQTPQGFKTLRDPPRPWNPSLGRNNYVATKNQAKEMTPDQSNPSNSLSGAKTIPTKPKSIFKGRNHLPRYLGNPASGVKPLYGVNNDAGSGKDSKEPSSSSSGSSTLNTTKSPSLITKIEPKTLSPISTTNSPIVSPPPYSPNARNYNAPFTRDIGRSTGSSLSPRNSPVNMFTNPFIPNSTPNTNPRIFPQGFMPPFSDAGRFAGPLMRSPLGISSAYHSLPASINRCIPRTYSGISYQGLQPPAVQRIPASSHSSPKSPKSGASSGSGGGNSGSNKNEEEAKGSSEGNNAFNLTKSGNGSGNGGNSATSGTSSANSGGGGGGASDLSKHNDDKSTNEASGQSKIVGKERERRKSNEEVKDKGKVDEDCGEKDVKREIKGDSGDISSCSKDEESDKEIKENEEKCMNKEVKEVKNSSGLESKINGGVNSEASGSSKDDGDDKGGDKHSDSDKDKIEKDNKINDERKDKEEVIVKESKCEELSKEIKAQEQRNKPES